MNLDGYASDEEPLSVPVVSNNSNVEVKEGPAFVTTSGAHTSFGGVFHKAIPLPKLDIKRKSKARKSDKKRSRIDPEDIDYRGPWAGSESSDEGHSEHAVSSDESSSENAASQENIEVEQELVSTELYTHESFMSPREFGCDLRHDKSSFPRKVKHTLEGHSKGVTQLRFFPKSGHLLLSCGNDGKIFLWNVTGEKLFKIRGYFGHSQAVKDVVFDSGGKRFLSCSYDCSVILWDTETGEIVKKLKVSGTPNCAIFNPQNQNEILVGLANRRIEHYDLQALDAPVQIYDHHLDAINSLTALSFNDGFMSTSSDRSVRFWKWHINIPTKIIAHPNQQSFHRAVVHPTERFIGLQSMDDTVYVVQEGGKYRFNKRKSFKGQKVGGYGIDIEFSTDGAYLMSGDSSGSVVVWSWKNSAVVQKIKVCDGLISTLAAHPSSSNVVAAAGKTGEIYVCN